MAYSAIVTLYAMWVGIMPTRGTPRTRTAYRGNYSELAYFNNAYLQQQQQKCDMLMMNDDHTLHG